MNKKVLGVFGSLLAIVMLATPVMAAPATKIEGVTATYDITFIPGEGRLVDHWVWQERNTLMIGVVTLDIPGQGLLVGTVNGVGNTRIKFYQAPPDPEAETNDHYTMTWTFEGEGTTGTFEGVGHRKGLGFPPFVGQYEEDYEVFHGTGDFHGQTLKLSYEGPLTNVRYGYLLIPN